MIVSLRTCSYNFNGFAVGFHQTSLTFIELCVQMATVWPQNEPCINSEGSSCFVYGLHVPTCNNIYPCAAKYVYSDRLEVPKCTIIDPCAANLTFEKYDYSDLLEVLQCSIIKPCATKFTFKDCLQAPKCTKFEPCKAKLAFEKHVLARNGKRVEWRVISMSANKQINDYKKTYYSS